MKKVYFFLGMFFLLNSVRAQIPILYYDFENNTTRTIFENSVEQFINSGSGAITRAGNITTVGNVTGAGTFNGGAATGQAATGNSWSSVTSDPGVIATDYYQFVVNTSGFSIITISLDNQASATGPSRVGILYSTDGSTFTPAITAPVLTGDAAFAATGGFMLPVGADNQGSVTIRVYAYSGSAGDRAGRSAFGAGGTFRIDNLTVFASTETASKTLLDYPAIGLSMRSGTAFTPTYAAFAISNNSIATCISAIIISTTLSIASGSTLADGSNTITVAGDITGTGTHTGAGNIAMIGVGKTLSGVTIGNLNIGTGSSIALSASPNVEGNLAVGTGATFDLNGNLITVNGDMINAGNLVTNLGTLDFTGTIGTQTLITGGTSSGKTFYNLSHSGASTLQLATDNLRVVNHFTNNAGPFNGNNLNVTIGGNFNATGTYTPGTGSLTFDGSANQAWSNNPANTYADVVINKVLGTVTLNNVVSMSATAILTLTSGTITLGANNLELNNNTSDPGGAISGSSPLSFIVTNGSGALQRAVSAAGTYGFPVGYSTAIQAAGITFTAPLGAANTLAARFIAGYGGWIGPPFSEDLDLINRISVIGYWEIVAGTLFSDSYTGSFVANGFGDIVDYSKLHLVKRADASFPWGPDGLHVLTTGTNPLAFLQRIGMSGFSQFAVGGESNVALPVSFLSFSGYKDGSRNQLRWTTVTELNNRGFELQRSTDGINFSAISFVNSLAPGGNSSDPVNYTFTDNAPAGIKQYYRLRQEDLAGAGRLSNIVLIRGSKPAGLSIDALFPNPAKKYVNLQVSSPESDKVTVIVTDMAGRNMIQQVNGIGAGSNTLALDISALQRGMYLVRVVGGDGTVSETARFVK